MDQQDHEREDQLIEAGVYGPMPEPQSLVMAGGWCAPSSVVVDEVQLIDDGLLDKITMPEVRVARGGIKFVGREPTERERIEWRANEVFAAFVRRHIAKHVGDTEVAKHVAVSEALVDAAENGWAVYVHRRDHTRFVGISLIPAEQTTIHYIEFDGGDYYTSWGHDADEFIDLIEDRI